MRMKKRTPSIQPDRSGDVRPELGSAQTVILPQPVAAVNRISGAFSDFASGAFSPDYGVFTQWQKAPRPLPARRAGIVLAADAPGGWGRVAGRSVRRCRGRGRASVADWRSDDEGGAEKPAGWPVPHYPSDAASGAEDAATPTGGRTSWGGPSREIIVPAPDSVKISIRSECGSRPLMM